jgi:hypothetical protein
MKAWFWLWRFLIPSPPFFLGLQTIDQDAKELHEEEYSSFAHRQCLLDM